MQPSITQPSNPQHHTVTLIPGDGVGPEAIQATRRLIDATGVSIQWDVCEAGVVAFKKGLSSGVPQETLDSIARNTVALKGPLETPVGYGEKSANVMLRKLFDTYANIRPIRSFPGVPTPFMDKSIDFVIVRENIEDLYAGIEYNMTPDVAQALKIMSRQGCARIVKAAFTFAQAQGRRKVQCATKANILKLTEGLLKQVFEEIAPTYPDIASSHLIIDNCAHQMVRFPETFDVVVMSNMNGDILSDMASGLIGGLGFAPGANIGDQVAIFEAVHGSAPRHAGLNTINPTAVILSGVMMLRHLGEERAAHAIETAVNATFAAGFHTRDVPGPAEPLSTTAFTDAVLRFMDNPQSAHTPHHQKGKPHQKPLSCPPSVNPTSVTGPHTQDTSWTRGGVDVSLHYEGSPDVLGKACERLSESSPLRFVFLDNRGFVVYPSSGLEVAHIPLWRLRLMARNSTVALTDDAVFAFLNSLAPLAAWAQITWLFLRDGKPAFTKAQGE